MEEGVRRNPQRKAPTNREYGGEGDKRGRGERRRRARRGAHKEYTPRGRDAARCTSSLWGLSHPLKHGKRANAETEGGGGGKGEKGGRGGGHRNGPAARKKPSKRSQTGQKWDSQTTHKGRRAESQAGAPRTTEVRDIYPNPAKLPVRTQGAKAREALERATNENVQRATRGAAQVRLASMPRTGQPETEALSREEERERDSQACKGA